MRRGFRLWHLVVLVFASALAFGAIRGVARETNGRALGIVSALVLSVASVGVSFGIIRLGRLVGGGATRRLMDWSVRRGGVVGFCGWLSVVLIQVGFVLAAIVAGPVVTLVVLAWSLRRLWP